MDPLERQEEEKDSIQADVISKLEDPQEIKHAREIFNEKLKAEKESKSEPPAKAEDTSEKIISESVPPESGDGKEEGKPAEQAPPETMKQIITQEMVDSYPEDYRPTLSKYLGKPVDEIAKALVNATKLIGKKNVQIEDTSPIENFYKKGSVPISEGQNDQVEIKELVDNRIREHYPDYPEDEAAQEEYLTDIASRSYLQARKFEKLQEKVTGELTEAYSKVKFIDENWGRINEVALTEEAEGIQNEIEDTYGITAEQLKKLGFDFSFDENFRNPLINKLLLNDKNQLDSTLFYSVVGTSKPLVRPGAIVQKFLRQNRPIFRDHITTNAASAALTRKEAKKVDANIDATRSSEVISGQKPLTEQEISQMTDLDTVRKELAKLGGTKVS